MGVQQGKADKMPKAEPNATPPSDNKSSTGCEGGSSELCECMRQIRADFVVTDANVTLTEGWVFRFWGANGIKFMNPPQRP